MIDKLLGKAVSLAANTPEISGPIADSNQTMNRSRYTIPCLSLLGCLLALFVLMPPSYAFGQDATVTFYAHGSSRKTGLPGSNSGMFWGVIYDGGQPLFSFYEGFTPKNDRFVTIRLPAGRHDFSASFDKHPSRKHHIPISLEPGKQYFFRAQSESRGVLLVESESGRIDQVTCEIASQEGADAKPLRPKHPSQVLGSSRIPATAMPSCEIHRKD